MAGHCEVTESATERYRLSSTLTPQGGKVIFLKRSGASYYDGEKEPVRVKWWSKSPPRFW